MGGVLSGFNLMVGIKPDYYGKIHVTYGVLWENMSKFWMAAIKRHYAELAAAATV